MHDAMNLDAKDADLKLVLVCLLDFEFVLLIDLALILDVVLDFVFLLAFLLEVLFNLLASSLSFSISSLCWCFSFS